MDTTLPPALSDAAELDRLYSPPSALIQNAVRDHLTEFHLAYLRVATFFCLASGSGDGLDASPRGGPPGFVHALDAHTIAFADWPGNNRIESMRNLLRDDRVGLVFLFPGLDVFLRINGRGRVSTVPDLLERVAEGQRRPVSAIVVAVEQVLFHCGKAIRRARLWDPDARVDRSTLPSVGKMVAELGQVKEISADQLDTLYERGLKDDLYGGQK
ncbi:pyridoxamine 5'-phosphate oxidase family protein [Xanthobacteraceae bacterium Astr-EGSB]|uniref:MSMEG_1061 family FMN-dependent PPOX-type flavoprotein n=1 Tax=Astrobacterium formosum TaxID=3069710 RepID=UPI0027B267E4|nr:pyridoxamine 5'-phosphate oxidase family protein [Xanthobacteraceae bacterium Astr-EGSB]